jgi:hypothetical protein
LVVVVVIKAATHHPSTSRRNSPNSLTTSLVDGKDLERRCGYDFRKRVTMHQPQTEREHFKPPRGTLQSLFTATYGLQFKTREGATRNEFLVQSSFG